MNSQQAHELTTIAARVQGALGQLGLCYEVKKAGLKVGVSFRSLQLVDAGDGSPADFGLLEVDLLRLPPRISADKLTRPNVLHHLTAVVGKPVYPLNTAGVTYCVDLRPASVRRNGRALADQVAFERIEPDGVALGMTVKGPLHVHPEHLQNVLIVGAQGTGKSAFLRLLTYQAVKSGWRLALADPDLATFNPDLWRGAEGLIGGRVASSPGEVSTLFDLVLANIERRTKLFNSAPGYPDSLTEYNKVTGAAMSRIMLLVDEANTYFADKGLVEKAADLSRRARKWGLHCVFAGHNWRGSDIPRGLSAMLQTRLAFRVNDDTSGSVVLERSGAEALPAVPGRAIIRLGGRYRVLQTYYLDKARLVQLVEGLPRSEVDDWLDVDGDDLQADNTGDDPLAERARVLYAQGRTTPGERLSKRQIALQVYGGDGGAAWRKLETALKSSTTTTGEG